MKKISNKKWQKALMEVQRGKEAEKIVKEWEQAKKENLEVFAKNDVIEIERTDDGTFRLTVQKLMETDDVEF